MVHAQPLSVPAGEEGAGRGHGTDHHAGQQLVQKQTAARQSRGGEGEVRHRRTACTLGRKKEQPRLLLRSCRETNLELE